MDEITRNVLIVVSGPSGVGKGTVLNMVRQAMPEMEESVSCTTRAPRQGERDGIDYFFVSKHRFEDMIERGELLEYSSHFGNFYGTPRAFVEQKLLKTDVVLEIDVDGALNVKKAYPAAVLIMITPPSAEELKRRLKNRGSESAEEIERRISRAEYELSKKESYDYIVENDAADKAAQEILKIIRTEKEVRAND